MKLLEKWMNDYEEAIYNKLTRTQNLMRLWKQAMREQSTLEVNGYDKEKRVEIPEMRSCCCWKIAPNWRRETLTINEATCTFIVESFEVEGEFYDHLLYEANSNWNYRRYSSYIEKVKKFDGFAKLLNQNGCSQTDVNWLEIGRSEEDIRKKAHKDMIRQKEAIEAKVKKICGNEITHIEETECDIYVKGSNGRIAHIWSIGAGGYNIQCYHIRVLVKEVK